MAEKAKLTVYKEIFCSRCEENFDINLEPVYDKHGFIKYFLDDLNLHVCPACGYVNKGEKATKDGKILIGK